MECEKITLEVKGTPLIKFQSAKRIESLRQGHLYAKNLKYYRELEKKTGDDEIGDEFEGMFHINEGSLSIPEKGEKIILNDTLIQTADSDDFVFCMLAINPSLNEFSFSDKQKEKILSFGDTALVVLDSEEFIRRVCLAAERNGYGVHFNTVKYFNPMTDSANMIFSLSKGMWNIAFWKRDKYAYQQEGRFVFTPRKRK